MKVEPIVGGVDGFLEVIVGRRFWAGRIEQTLAIGIIGVWQWFCVLVSFKR